MKKHFIGSIVFLDHDFTVLDNPGQTMPFSGWPLSAIVASPTDPNTLLSHPPEAEFGEPRMEATLDKNPELCTLRFQCS